ncbi:guanylate-binding protein 1-like [Pseudophryne corroboree]|uniref:guanylate-binding protein 1-like n=1 Tax=Pseudophryne corroboree TaxID=495146 RepID=UPI003081AFDD
MEIPLCLIENPENGKFRVNPEAIDVLSQISQPVVVVAIVGLYRTGKSYLMNKLAGARRGFDLGSNVQAKTKGIWMWCLPHPTKDNHTLVLLDTEGLGDVEKGDTRNDTWIFCLAVLLSSTFVYNSRGVIDEDAIEKLRFVGEMSEFIKVKTKNNDDEEDEFSRHFPAFVWAVRDFTLRLELDGEAITADDYLENALKLQKDGNNKKMRNTCRDCIRMYFKSRKCFVFGFPTGDKYLLQRMDEVSETQLSPAFVAQTREFCDHIYETAGVKRLAEIHAVTGRVLGDLANLYVEAIGSSNVACLENVAGNISDSQNKAAVRDATQYYEATMKERVVFPTETLKQFMELSKQCENEALQMFLKKAFKDKDLLYQTEFMKNIEMKKSEFSGMNDMRSREYCQELIRKHTGDFEKAVTDGLYSTSGGYQRFKEDMKLLEEKYNSEPHKGTQAETIIQEFQKSKESLGNTIMMNDNVLSEMEKKQEEERMRKEKEEMKKKMDEIKSSEEKLKSEDQKRTLEENFKQLLEKMRAENRMLRDSLMSTMHQKSREQQLYAAQGCEKHARMYQEQVHDLQRKRDELGDNGWVQRLGSVFQLVLPLVLPKVVTIGGAIILGIAKYFSR